MNGHLPDELLGRFAGGDLSTDEAARVALHLDACPLCAGRATALDPLSPAFASVDDPPVPEGLEDAILAAAARPLARIAAVWPVAAALLAAAAVLLVVGGDPAGLVASGGHLAGAVLVAGSMVGADLSLPILLGAGAVLGLASSLVVFGLLRHTREAP